MNGIRRPRALVVLSLAVLAGSVSIVKFPTSVDAATGTVTGTVFNDFDVNGTRRTTDDTTNFLKAEPGVDGVTVRAFDATGTLVGTAVTASGGSYTLTVASASTADVRVEFTVPDGFESSFAPSGGSTVQFVSLGATNVDLGIQIPGDYCQGKPNISAVCMVGGSRSTIGPTIRTVPFYAPASALNNVAKNDGVAGTGGTWGLAHHRPSATLWTSAFLRRTVGIGPKGLGGIYVFKASPSTANTPEQVASFDLSTLGLVFQPPSVDFSDTARGLRSVLAGNAATNAAYATDTTVANDAIGHEWVGRAGIGDIDITTDGQWLWLVNLYQRAVHRIAIGGTSAAPTLGAVTTWNIDAATPCQVQTSIARPFALDLQPDGTVLVGAACAAMDDTPTYTEYAEGAVVLRLDPANSSSRWSEVLRSPLSYPRRLENCDWRPSGVMVKPCVSRWMAWTNNFAAVEDDLNFSTTRWPQPMLTDIEVLRDGSIVTAFNDRLSYQFAGFDLRPSTDKTTQVEVYTSGDSRLFCKVGTSYYEENAGNCGPAGSPTYVGAKNWSDWENEFFYDQLDSRHRENTIGALALAPKHSTQPDQIAFTMMDPTTTNVNGVSWNKLSDGSKIVAVNLKEEARFPGFGKSSGMGDIEVLCDMAPIQIGNRVWYDTDNDGIQDPGEAGIPGITVRLYDAAGTLVSTAVTNAAGEYRFSSTVSELPTGGGSPDWSGGNLLPNTEYTIRLDEPAHYSGNAGLSGLFPTRADATTLAATDQDDSIDSDAVLVGGTTYGVDRFPRITVPPLGPGETNHTFDVGFGPPSVSIGDRVWLDANQDGQQDAGESGFGNVTVQITKDDGSPAVDLNGQPVTSTVTDAEGNYIFTNLPAGAYTVTVVPPAGTSTTTAASSTSSTLALGQSELTHDVGLFVPTVSVGDRVWLDVDRDGIQDTGETGIAGVTLTITKADGTAVTDVFGNPVTTTTTDANGNYSFDGLPVGQYRVAVTPPAGYVASGANASAGSATSVSLTTNGAEDLSLDFGYALPSVSVGDLVWFDTDQDGVQDVGEPGIAGVTLTITNADGTAVTDVYGNAVTTTTTDANGNYLFAGLPFGQYEVTVTPPAGSTATLAGQGAADADSSTGDELSATLSTDGAADRTLDFGFFQPSVSVGDRVWFDTDQDGVQDAGESGIAGVTLTITDANGGAVTDVFGNPVTTTTTDADGNYSFDGLPAGTYTVTVSPPGGYTATGVNATAGTATSTSLTADGDRDPTLDFGYFMQRVTVGGVVWTDADADGVRDTGETGLAGSTLAITDANGDPVTDVYGAPVTTTTTDAAGRYTFSDLPPGQYRVSIVTPDGRTATTPTTVTSTVLSGGQTDDDLDFGVSTASSPSSASSGTGTQSAATIAISERVWLDADRDCSPDTGEPGVAGLTVTLTTPDGSSVVDAAGQRVAPVTTDADGRFSFTGLLPGEYLVVLTLPDPYESSVTSLRWVDGRLPGSSGCSGGFPVFAPRVTVSGSLWSDTDGDGRQDRLEPAMSGVTLGLFQTDGTVATNAFGLPVGTIVTDADGNYRVLDLLPGMYVLVVDTPAGMVLAGVGANGIPNGILVDATGADDTEVRVGGVAVIPQGLLPTTGHDGRSAEIALVVVLLGCLAALMRRRPVRI